MFSTNGITILLLLSVLVCTSFAAPLDTDDDETATFGTPTETTPSAPSSSHPPEIPPVFPLPPSPPLDTSSVELEASKKFISTYPALKPTSAVGDVLKSRTKFASFTTSNQPGDPRLYSQISDAAMENSIKITKLQFKLEREVHKLTKLLEKLDTRTSELLAKRVVPLEISDKINSGRLDVLDGGLGSLAKEVQTNVARIDADISKARVDANEMHQRSMAHTERKLEASLENMVETMLSERKLVSSGGGTDPVFDR